MADKAAPRKQVRLPQSHSANADYIKKTLLNALNGDPEIKNAFKPSAYGLKAGANTYLVQMTNGETYRVEIVVTEPAPEVEA